MSKTLCCACTTFLLGVSMLPAHAAGCRTPSFRFNDEGVTSVNTYASKNSVCRLSFSIRNAYSGDAGILSSTISQRPKLGKLGKTTVRQFAYVPDRDVTGEDSFAINVRYERGGQLHNTTVGVAVHISE